MEEKAEFRNDSPGVTGVVTVSPGEKPMGVAVGPGDTIWLTEEEQILTANAPRRAENNPFTNGTLTLVTEPQEIANRRPIGHTTKGQVPQGEEQVEAATRVREKQEADAKLHQEREAEKAKLAQEQAEAGARPARPVAEETGVQVEPVGAAPEGERAVDEEVGTPEAEEKPGAADIDEKAAKPAPAPVPKSAKAK